MKYSLEDELSAVIDALNESRTGKSLETNNTQEIDELSAIAVRLKNLPEMELPGEEFAHKVAGQFRAKAPKVKQAKFKQSKFKAWFTPVGITAAGLLVLLLLLSPWSFFADRDVVLAMGEKVNSLANYHGTLEMRTVTGDNQSWLVRRVEIWNQGEKYAIKDQDGVVTVNNGEKKWQVQPQARVITLLPVLPDQLQGRFDLRAEGTRAASYPHRVIGQETVSGRETAKIEISPPGGQPYYLWIDAASKLPVQLETSMQNGIKTVYTLLNLDINQEIAGDIFRYNPDPQYKVLEKEAGKLVSTLDEAGAVAGFSPVVPKETPQKIWAAENRIALDYNGTVITETKQAKPLDPVPNASTGKADGGVLEILGERLRWQQKGLEFSIEGPQRLELARQIVKDLTLPRVSEDLSKEAKVKVPVDLEIVKNQQQQVDGGHSPWNLDPIQVSQVFINSDLKATPPIEYENIKLELNNGTEAVYTVSNGPAKKIFLKRVVRQDETGIWSVVGYDPR